MTTIVLRQREWTFRRITEATDQAVLKRRLAEVSRHR